MDLRIGILECDHVDPKLRDKHGDYHDMFIDLIHAQDNSIEFSIYDLIADQFPVDLSSCDAYIITGSKFGAYEDIPWINKAKELVNRLYDLKIPTVGICFGHQLIAESLGGKVIKAEDKGRGLGVQTWNIKSKPVWMTEISSKILSLNACHQDQVIELPKNSNLLLSSEFCPVAMYQTGSMLGIQGHPEFDTDYTHHLLDKYSSDLTVEDLQKNKDSFNTSANSDLVGSCIVSFIKSKLN